MNNELEEPSLFAGIGSGIGAGVGAGFGAGSAFTSGSAAGFQQYQSQHFGF